MPRNGLLRLFVVLFAVALGSRAAADPSRSLDDYVVLGLTGARLGNGAFIDAGNVGANASGAKVQLGHHAFMGTGTQLVGDQAKVLPRVSLCDLFTNDLLSSPSQITVRCSGPTPFAPLPLIDPLPTLPVFAPGTAPVDVLGSDVL